MGPNDLRRWSSGPHEKPGASDGVPATVAVGGGRSGVGRRPTVAVDAGGRPGVGRRRFVGGVLAAGAALSGVGRADAGGANVGIEFVDCVTVEITGDVDQITGLHFHVFDAVDVIDDHLTVEDVAGLTPGTTVFDVLRIKQHDPDAGVLVVAVNTLAYNYLSTADVYLGGDPDFFGAGADVSRSNTVASHVALTDVVQDRGTFTDGDAVTAEATLVNFSEQRRDAFLGYSAVGPDGLAYTNGGTTGTAVTLAPGETATHTVGWEVEADAPDGDYDAHVAVWRESDRDALQTRYDERYVHGAFAVGDAVDASIDGVALPGGTFDDGEVVSTDVTVRNAGAREHTFFVGYSVIGPDDLAYTNGGTTGTPVKLAPGETRTVTVDWTVESDAPSGTYDVHVAVWAEDSPDELETKLDEEIHRSVFEVA